MIFLTGMLFVEMLILFRDVCGAPRSQVLRHGVLGVVGLDQVKFCRDGRHVMLTDACRSPTSEKPMSSVLVVNSNCRSYVS